MYKYRRSIVFILCLLVPIGVLLLSREIAWVFWILSMMLFMYLKTVYLILFIAANIAAFFMVLKDNDAGYLFSAAGGGIGAFIGTFINRKYKYKKDIGYCFAMWLFVTVIYPLTAYLLFESEYYSMLM